MHYIGLKSRGLVSQTKIIKNVVQNKLVNNMLALGTSDNSGNVKSVITFKEGRNQAMGEKRSMNRISF